MNYRKILIVFVFFSIHSISCYGQVTIFSENMGTPAATTTLVAYVTGTAPATFQNNATLTYSFGAQTNPADVRISSQSSGYAGASGNGNVFLTSAAGAYGFSIESINALGYTSLTLNYGYRKESAGSLATFSVDYWDGLAWVTIANTSAALFNEAAGAATGWYAAKQLALPIGTQINGLKIRFVKVNGSAAAIRLDDIKLTGTAPITSKQNGPWTDVNTWTGLVVPVSGVSAIIQHSVYLTANTTRDAGTITTVDLGATLKTDITAGANSWTYTNNGTTNINGTFEIDNNGSASGTNFVYGAASTLYFNNTLAAGKSVLSTDPFWPVISGPFNVTVNTGGISMQAGAARTVTGALITPSSGLTVGVKTIAASSDITIGGTATVYLLNDFQTASPIYNTNSTLIYNGGITYNRGLEWGASGIGTIGTTPGYPYNVTITGNTQIRYNTTAGIQRAMAGSLTINLGSNLNMAVSATQPDSDLTIGGSVTNDGTFTFSKGSAGAGSVVVGGSFTNSGIVTMSNLPPSGGHLKVGGDFTNTGTFTPADRSIYFTKPGVAQVQIVTSSTALTFPYVYITGTDTTVQLNSDLTISAPSATINSGVAITYSNANDYINLNGRTLTIGTNLVANTISGSGGFKGTAASNLSLLGTGSIGTLKFGPLATDMNIGTFTMNRTTSGGCVMGSALTVNTSLALTNGIVDLANTAMTIGASATITGASSSNFIIADVANGSTASLLKTFSAAGTFTFPIGDSSGSADGTQYSPISATFTGGSYGGYAGFAVNDIKDANMDATTDYITRTWSMFSSGITPTSYDVTATYLPVDIAGTEANSESNQWNGSAWINGGTAIGSNILSKTGNTTLPATNHFSAGYRDPEINIKQGATNYLTASTYDFGTVLTSNTSSITFTIQNLGSQTLTLSAATFSNSTDYTYTTAYATSVSGLSSVTFVVTFNPLAAGTFTGNISIPNNDTSGSENPYVINFTGVGSLPPTPEINIRAGSGGFGSITSGNVTTTNGLQNTAFGSINLGSSVTKSFQIQNNGAVASILTLSGAPLVSVGGVNPGDFVVTTVPSSSSIVAGSNTTFIITFTPSFVGSRSAIVSVANNDSDENPYTFLINGTGVCVVSSTITPSSGPVGTEISITATTGTLTAASATLNGLAATVTQIDATHITAIVPASAVSGTLLTTNNQGCGSANTFTVLDNASTSCQGGLVASDLFFSEVTDSNTGGLTYVEIYNGTLTTKTMSNYSIKLAANGNASYSSITLTTPATLAPGSTFIIAFGDDDLCATYGGDGNLALQVSAGLGVNFDAYVVGPPSKGNDHYALFNGATQIDSWGTYLNPSWAPASISTEGATFRRKNTVTAPNTTYSNSDWNIIDFYGVGSTYCANNDYSDIGVYNFRAGVPPTVTTLSYTPTCKATTLTVTGSEGVAGGFGLVYKWYAVQNGSNTWNLISDGGIYSGATTNALYISDIATILNYQFYCQVWENTATCYIASNAVKITSTLSTTWQAGGWTNGVPTLNQAVVIDSDYDTANALISPFPASFSACSLTINNGKTVTIRASDYANIQNDLTVSVGGNLTVENNGSLVMIDDNGVVTNSGTTQIKRTSTAYERFDYVYWSSPVVSADANIISTFAGWRTDYSFEFNTANFYDVKTINSAGTVTAVASDSFDDYAPWAWLRYTSNMTSGKGYAIMAPTSVAFSPSALGQTVTFSGKVNNGVVPLTLVQTSNTDAGYIGVNNANDDYNLVGNPYPSALFADKFITDNGANTSGTLYFWTHVADISVSNPGPNIFNFVTADYAYYNLSGGTVSGTGSTAPTGKIASGQGFFVEAQSTNSLVFNNSMRNKNYLNNDFFRSSTGANEKDRLWLNLQNPDGLFSQLLVAYFDETTLGFDWAYDGRVNLSNNYVSFYSMAGAEKYKIQARPTFDTSDIVPLGYFSAVTGPFTISLDQKEGILNSDATFIYIEDRELNIIHDLKQSPYTFTTNYGRYENRFVLRYTDTALGNPNFETLDSSVVVATNHGEMTIKSYIENIEEVTVYDILGRKLFFAKALDTNNFVTSNISNSQQALIVKIKLSNGTVVSRKVIL